MKKLVVLFLLAGLVCAQKPDANKILKEVYSKFTKVKDYTVDVAIKLDVSFVKMADSKVKVYFKQPDKVHVESTGFSLIPAQAVNFNPAKYLTEDFVAVYLKQDIIDGKKVDVLNLLPKSDTAKVKFVKLWIDRDEKVIRKFETTADRGGSVLSELSYGSEIKYALPSQIKVSMDFGNARLPGMNNRRGKEDNKEKKEKKGSATVTYSNYSINKGIDDKLFLEKKK